MGRKRLIEQAELIKYIDRYLYEELNGVPDKLTAANISRYLKSTGLNIEPRIISRDPVAMAHINALKEAHEQADSLAPVVFKPLDIDAFIKTNSSPQTLKRALAERDQYYSDVADASALVVQKLHDRNSEFEAAQAALEEAKKKLESAEEAAAIRDKEIRTLKANNRALKNTIDTYIKPAIANELLKKDGYLSDSVETLVTSTDFDEKIITADTEVSNLLAQELLDAFED
ncbi:MAG: hypothetical protein J6D57_13290 [Mogibacterium sp.]|nr:hypothetical protein [Mogibacterium sp.]